MVQSVPPESAAQTTANEQMLLYNLVKLALTDVGTLERAGAQPVEARGGPSNGSPSNGSPSGGLAMEQLAVARRRATAGVVALGRLSAAVVHLEGCAVRLWLLGVERYCFFYLLGYGVHGQMARLWCLINLRQPTSGASLTLQRTACCVHVPVFSQGLTDITSALLALHRTVQLQMATRASADDVSALVVSLITALGQARSGEPCCVYRCWTKPCATTHDYAHTEVYRGLRDWQTLLLAYMCTRCSQRRATSSFRKHQQCTGAAEHSSI